MEDPMVLLSSPNTTHERYNRLQGLFNEFCAHIMNLIKEDNKFAIFAIEQSGNTLTVNFLDRKIEARFLFFIDDYGAQKGYIHCQLLSPTEGDEPILIGKFSFNGQGEASITTNNDDDQYTINDRKDAITILLNWATISVKEKLLTMGYIEHQKAPLRSAFCCR